CGIDVRIVQVTTKLGDNDWFARCDFHKARIGLAHFERETLSAIAGHGSGWSVGAESDPVAIGLTRKIILEAVPFLLWLIEPVHVPDPLEICGIQTSCLKSKSKRFVCRLLARNARRHLA